MTTNVYSLMHQFIRAREAVKTTKAELLTWMDDVNCPDFFFQRLFTDHQDAQRRLAEIDLEMRSHPDFDADELHEVVADYYAYDPTSDDRD